MPEFPLFPDSASTVAAQVDYVLFALLGLSALILLGIFSTIVYFAIKYRRGSSASRANPVEQSYRLEALWTIVPLILSMGIFLWAGSIYFNIQRQPSNALEVYVVAKQWMWKIQHQGGQAEINELHVPLGRPVKLIMTSQDVIHSFYVPAFRLKQDVLPGRYTNLWFEATQTGTYHLFCAEYCGTAHAEMTGSIVVMEPEAYAAWLAGRSQERAASGPGQSMAAGGEQIFQAQGCDSCHRADGSGVGPSLQGLFGAQVQLAGGGSVTADETYLRRSILNPTEQIAAGYQAVMPSFQGQLSEEEIMQLITYIKSLGQEASSTP